MAAKSRVNSSITLENERSAGVEKVKNELGVWHFFKYIYGKYVFRLLGSNFLMLVFLVPAYLISMNFDGMINIAAANLPYANSFGLGVAPWSGIADYLQSFTNDYNTQEALWLLLGIPAATVAISGGFAIVRDAYWTGKLNVIKPFFKGVYKTGLQILPFSVVIALMFFGMNYFNIATQDWANWIAIIAKIILYAIIALFGAWALVYSGVVTLYEQSVKKNITASLQLCRRYAVPILVRLVLSVAPFVILWSSAATLFYTFILTIIAILGMFYFALIWVIFMLRTCASHTVGGRTVEAKVEDAEAKVLPAKG